MSAGVEDTTGRRLCSPEGRLPAVLAGAAAEVGCATGLSLRFIVRTGFCSTVCCA